MPGFCPKSSLPSIAAVCFLPTGAKATCISAQRAVFEKTLAALDPLGCLTIYIFSNVILSPYLLTPTITTQVCEKQNKKKKASFFCQQGCDEEKLAVCWGRRVAPGLSWIHTLVSCNIPLRFPCCRHARPQVPECPGWEGLPAPCLALYLQLFARILLGAAFPAAHPEKDFCTRDWS